MRSVVDRNFVMRRIPAVTGLTEVLETSTCKAKMFQEEQRTTLKMKPGTTSSETSVIIKQSTRRRIPENVNLYQQRFKNLQSSRIYLTQFSPRAL